MKWSTAVYLSWITFLLKNITHMKHNITYLEAVWHFALDRFLVAHKTLPAFTSLKFSIRGVGLKLNFLGRFQTQTQFFQLSDIKKKGFFPPLVKRKKVTERKKKTLSHLNSRVVLVLSRVSGFLWRNDKLCGCIKIFEISWFTSIRWTSKYWVVKGRVSQAILFLALPY